MGARPKLTARRRARFLDILRQNCNVSEAAREIGVARQRLYVVRDNDPAFANRWDEAEQEGLDKLEREAWRRGVDGFDRPIIFQGAVTGTYKDYSDRMLELLLKAHRPKYRERQDATTINVQVNAIKWVVEATTDGTADQGRAGFRPALEAEPL